MSSNVPKKIRAAVLEELGKPLTIKNLDLPALLQGQVLVKVHFSGVCRSQLMEVSGGRGADPWLPHLLGHEGSGTVISIGENITKVAVGDHVIMGWVKGDGVDAPGAKYHCNNQIINSGRVTTFSNYTIVSESRLVKKPVGLPFDVATLFGCALPTGAGMVLNELNPQPSDTVAVLGLGGIGLSALMTLKAIGIQKIIAIDVSEEKLKLAKSLGATYIINSHSEDCESALRKITSQGVDICIESAGTVTTIEQGFKLIRQVGGQLLFASHPPEGDKISLAPHELISGKKISGSWGGGSKPDIDIPRMYKIFSNAKIPIESLLTKRYRLEDINAALEDLRLGSVFRPLIVMNHCVDNISE
jgi:S-(hydroxymethyl)glutathione dehydrogenase/alcohol dehydrogenase